MISFRRRGAQPELLPVERIEAALEAVAADVADADADLLLVEWSFPQAPAVSDAAEPVRLPLGGAA